MVRITKVYTKTGDKGKTSLAGGQQVAKNSQRICAYGTVDELNAHLGSVAEMFRESGDNFEVLKNRIFRIQNELFDLGSQLAVLQKDRRENTPVIQMADIKRLEDEIDEMNEHLPMLKSFILPGGGELSVRFHIARTVCRRAERELFTLSETEQLDETELPYLNRLSDWLFVAGRYAAHKNNITETLWQPGKR